MLDHAFMDAIEALRTALDGALLERHAAEEELQVDILLGDLTWETAYSLPGEGLPPRVVAEVTLEWPTWSQTAYRSWCIGEPVDDGPEINVEVLVRVQRLATMPDPAVVRDALPDESSPIGDENLRRSAPTVEQLYDNDLKPVGAAVEVAYEGVYRVEKAVLDNGASLDRDFASIGGWIASTLVRLGDLELEFLPPFDGDTFG